MCWRGLERARVELRVGTEELRRKGVGAFSLDSLGDVTVGGVVLEWCVDSTEAGAGSGGALAADLELRRCPWALTKDMVKDTALCLDVKGLTNED